MRFPFNEPGRCPSIAASGNGETPRVGTGPKSRAEEFAGNRANLISFRAGMRLAAENLRNSKSKG